MEGWGCGREVLICSRGWRALEGVVEAGREKDGFGIIVGRAYSAWDEYESSHGFEASRRGRRAEGGGGDGLGDPKQHLSPVAGGQRLQKLRLYVEARGQTSSCRFGAADRVRGSRELTPGRRVVRNLRRPSSSSERSRVSLKVMQQQATKIRGLTLTIPT